MQKKFKVFFCWVSSLFDEIPVVLIFNLKMSYYNRVVNGGGKEFAYFCIYSIFNDYSLGAAMANH
jgi:hypothetical protein